MMLDEFVAIMGCHRKHAVRLLRQGEEPTAPSAPKGQRIYDEAVREALTVVWEASDRICGKRLKAALPSMVESLERHGHLDLDPGVRRRLFSASAATIDRLMRPIREQAGSRRKRKQKRKMAGRIPVRTFSDWKEPEPGYLEIDLVAHCGGTVTGSYISEFSTFSPHQYALLIYLPAGKASCLVVVMTLRSFDYQTISFFCPFLGEIDYLAVFAFFPFRGEIKCNSPVAGEVYQWSHCPVMLHGSYCLELPTPYITSHVWSGSNRQMSHHLFSIE